MSTEAPPPFRLLKKVGERGAVEYHLARVVSSGRDVLVKLVKAELANDPVAIGKLADEAKVTASLRHPAILQHVASGWLVDGRPFLALELVEGPTLRAHLDLRGPVPAPTLARLLAPLCRALHHAHAQGVIHRDLRPENVLLAGGLEALDPKLIELGKASFPGTPTVLSGAEALPTDPRYLAPECIDGQPADARSELYALGVLAYEAATGTLPFPAQSESELLLSHLQDPPPHLPADASGLDAIVQRCLAKLPSARFPSAEAAAAALEELSGGILDRPAAAPPPAPPQPQSAAPPPAGEGEAGIAGSYNLLRVLGKGAMGTVYLAAHRRLGKQVAIKVLLPEHCRDAALMQRFFQEARSVNEINHENIVEIHDFVEEPGRAYCVMELLTGSDLRTLMDRELLQVARIVSIADQVCAALAAAHRVGVVHRDVKPDNIFITRRAGADFVKVLDFGVAKLMKPLAGSTAKTLEGSIVGTPLYMAPEQAAARAVDPRADIYSVGAVLYELLAGRPPFQDRAVAALMVKILSAPVPPLPAQAVSGERIPGPLGALVMRCLERDPRRRPQSMVELRRDLARALPRGASPQRPARKGLAVALGLVALAAIGWALWQTPGVVDQQAVRDWLALKIPALRPHLVKAGPSPAPSPPQAPTSPGAAVAPEPGSRTGATADGGGFGGAPGPPGDPPRAEPPPGPDPRDAAAPAPEVHLGSPPPAASDRPRRAALPRRSPDASIVPPRREEPLEQARPLEPAAAPERGAGSVVEELLPPVLLDGPAPSPPQPAATAGDGALVIELDGTDDGPVQDLGVGSAPGAPPPAASRGGRPVIEIGPDGQSRIVDSPATPPTPPPSP